MSFLRRNKEDKKSTEPVLDPVTGMPPPFEDPSKKKDEAPKGNIFQRLQQYIIDSYNGLYKIVLEPSMPTKQTPLLIVLGVIIGFIFAYGIFPVEFTGASPYRMNQDAIDQWVKMVAVGYERQVAYSEDEVVKLLNQLPNPRGTIDRLMSDQALSDGDRLALQSVQSIPQVGGVTGTPPPADPGFFGSLIQWLIPILLVIIIVPIFVVVWRLLIYPNIVAGIIDRIKEARDPEYKAEKARRKKDLETLKDMKNLKDAMAKNVVADVELGAPVMQTISIYTKGRNYDDSFAIELGEDQGNQFLGECGVSIATKVGDDVQALEFWGFDMATQQTLAKIFAVPSSLSDPSFRAKVDNRVDNPAIDIIPAQVGGKNTLETDAIRIQAEIMTIKYNDAGGTPNSGIENVQLNISAWQKHGTPAKVGVGIPPPMPAPQALPSYDDISFAPPPPMPSSSTFAPPPPMPPAGGRSLDDYDEIEFDPPPPMPSPGFAPQSPLQPPIPGGGLKPLSPPPLQPPGSRINPLSPPPMQMPPQRSLFDDDEEDDDDPFGGTGDFTPLT